MDPCTIVLAPRLGVIFSSLARKRTALLAYLALEAPGDFVRRDVVLATFWPDLGAAQARQSLRQAVYYLRRELGDAVITSRGADFLGASGSELVADVTRFRQAVAANEWEEALGLYRGELLPGFFIPDASEQFDHWLDTARAQCRREAVHAAAKLAQRDEAAGEMAAAAGWARKAWELAPDDQAIMRLLLRLLDAGGEPIAALKAFGECSLHLEREFGLEPSEETQAVAEAIRDRAAAVRGAGRVSAPPRLPAEVVRTRPTRRLAPAGQAPFPGENRNGLVALCAMAAVAMVASVALFRKPRRN